MQTSVIEDECEFEEKESEFWSSCEISDKIHLGHVSMVAIIASGMGSIKVHEKEYDW